MNILFFDVETNGLPKNGKQPNICQFAAIVQNKDKAIKYSNIIKPNGWTIPDETAKIHGITTERAHDEGVPIAEVLAWFWNAVANCETIVAHNLYFDERVILAESARQGLPFENITIGKYCTMRKTKSLCELPLTDKQAAAGFGGFKNPKLQEAHLHFFGKEFENAHNAIADVKACRDIYNAIQTNEEI